jgi:glycosyltransferase involved in cell wall biosynthesis
MTVQRVLFVADSLEVGGAERALMGLAVGLAARGTQVTLACSVGGALAVDAEISGVGVLALGTRQVKRRADASFAWALREEIVGDPPDLVHSHMYASTVAAAHALSGLGIPLVVHELSEAFWRDKRARRIAAVAYRSSAAVIAVSAAIGRRLLEVDRVSAAKIHLIPNTLPDLPTKPSESAWSRSEGVPLVGVVARLQHDKGVAVFLRAVDILSKRLPAARFVIVGDGPERRALQRFASDRRLPVTFLGFRADAQALIAQLDLLVVPSYTEGTPLVVLEAANAGVPVVATAVGGIPEQVRDGIEAVLVPAGNHRALGDACFRVLSDAFLGERLAAAGRRRVHEADPAKTIDAIERIYTMALNAAPVM